MKNKKELKNLFELLKPYTNKLIFITIFLLVSTVIAVAQPLLNRRIIDEGFMSQNIEVVVYSTIAVLALVIIDKIINIVKEKIRATICADMKYELYDRYFRRLVKIKINSFNNTNYVEQYNNINMDIENISKITDGSLLFAVSQVFYIIGGIIGLLLVNYKLIVLVLVFIPVKFILVKYFAKIRKEIFKKWIEKSSETAQWFGDTIGGIREVKLYNLSLLKHKEFNTKEKDVLNLEKKSSVLDAYNTASEGIVVQFFVSLMYIFGCYMVLNMNITVGSVLAFVTYSTYVTAPITAILNIGYLLVGIFPSTKRYFEFLERSIEENVHKDNKMEIDKEKGVNIEFRNVDFAYEDGQPILKNVSFSINNKEKTSLVGLNGSGKSTILNLLLRFYEPLKGEILLNSINIEKYDIEEYRSYISTVSQDIYLFDTSIKNNIFLDKDFDEELFNKIISNLNLQEVIEMFPENLNIGQNGIMLSGGQRQKIAIARALARDSQLVILDEASSSLDIDSENKLSSLINTLERNKTVLMITHKLSDLKESDKVIFLNKGKVNYVGKHEILLESSEEYKALVDQFNKEKNPLGMV